MARSRQARRQAAARVVAAAGCAVVGAAAIAGSVGELLDIGGDISYGWPPAIPAALDGLAVVSTAALAARPRDRHALAGLLGAACASIGLQVAAVLAPEQWAPIEVAVHVLVVVSAALAVHLGVRVATDPAASDETRAPRRRRADAAPTRANQVINAQSDGRVSNSAPEITHSGDSGVGSPDPPAANTSPPGAAELADIIEPHLGARRPTQRVVADLAAAHSPESTQRVQRAAAAILQRRRLAADAKAS